MTSRQRLHSPRVVALATLCLLLAGNPAVVGAASETPGSGIVQGVSTIATGTDQNVDGFLSIAPDDFGQWASVTFSGGGDIFNPAGAFLPLEATFTSALFLFVPSRSQRAVLTENPDHLGTVFDGSLTLAVTSPSVGSDTNGDTVDDTLMSSFTATGTDTALSVDLTQSVTELVAGVSAVVQQDYTITNDAAMSADLVLARVYDGDLLWDGDFSNDQVGTGTNAGPGDTYVFEQEASDPATSVTLSSPIATSYFGGKNGVLPGLGAPPYNFGTDTEVFDNFGVPTSWVNNIAGVGYDTDGVSGTAPAGSTAPEDGFAGLGFQLTLPPGATATVTVYHTYGQERPEPPAPAEPIIAIPTLGFAGLLALALALVIAGGAFMRRRHVQ